MWDVFSLYGAMNVISEQTGFSLSINYTKQEMDSVISHETVLESPSPQAHTPINLSNHKSLNTSHTKQHSKGLLTPCRQVGLRRKSFRNSISPSNSDSILAVTPRNLRFVSPVGNYKEHRKFKGGVLDTHIPHEEETCKSSGRRLHLENTNEKTEKTNEKGPQSDTDIHSCKDLDLRNKSYDAYNVINSQSSGGERAIKRPQMENLNDETQQCNVDTASCKDSDLQSDSYDEHSFISSKGRNEERAIETTLTESKNNITHQVNADTHSSKYLEYQGNSCNEDNMNSSDSITECTEDNLNILKRQITAKEEEVKRLKLTLLYKKKVVHVNKPILSSSVCLVNSFFLTFGVFQI